MNLDTYRSTLVDGVFVTLPSTSAKSTIGLLDDLAALRLDPVKREYEFSEDERYAPFARFVLTEIVLKGYARHGSDGSFCETPAAGKALRRSRGD
jgi:hypothetical protein